MGRLTKWLEDAFADGVTETLQARGMKPLTIANISHIVSLWDPLKQKAALNALEYAIWQKELSIDLGERLDQFLVEVGYRTAMADDKTTEPTLAAEPAPETEPESAETAERKAEPISLTS